MTTPAQAGEPSPQPQNSTGTFVVIVCALVFLGAGFALGRFANHETISIQSVAAGHSGEQVGILRNVTSTGTFETFYAQPFASPPALEIVDEHGKDGWGFRVIEQRADGFKIEVSAGGGGLNDKPLRYVARGVPFDGTLLTQEGEALVPTADYIAGTSARKPGELEVFYRTPFPSPPHLSFPDGIGGCRVTEQKATGFKLLREATSGLSHEHVRWRAEQAIRR